ncbi:FeoB-associated Cys-rich membrane protein [Acidaminococcus fermentans]|nr:FeoB-associated Cys-rich membrane protein [Acidaminococcus fermentans]MEE1598995.1 FeoB-associated Cys-rich membrane protein [Acidaminococcus fermentans]MEE4123257.1 FeoB-associated Cys-rich membrane protein [Acidaminococcus fermentans]
MGTFVVGLVLFLIVAAVIRKMYKDHKAGKSCCGGNCGSCGLCRGNK